MCKKVLYKKSLYVGESISVRDRAVAPALGARHVKRRH